MAGACCCAQYRQSCRGNRKLVRPRRPSCTPLSSACVGQRGRTSSTPGGRRESKHSLLPEHRSILEHVKIHRNVRHQQPTPLSGRNLTPPLPSLPLSLLFSNPPARVPARSLNNCVEPPGSRRPPSSQTPGRCWQRATLSSSRPTKRATGRGSSKTRRCVRACLRVCVCVCVCVCRAGFLCCRRSC